MQEQMEPMVGVLHFSCINLKSGFLQVNFFAVVKSFEYSNAISANFVQIVKNLNGIQITEHKLLAQVATSYQVRCGTAGHHY